MGAFNKDFDTVNMHRPAMATGPQPLPQPWLPRRAVLRLDARRIASTI